MKSPHDLPGWLLVGSVSIEGLRRQDNSNKGQALQQRQQSVAERLNFRTRMIGSVRTLLARMFVSSVTGMPAYRSVGKTVQTVFGLMLAQAYTPLLSSEGYVCQTTVNTAEVPRQTRQASWCTLRFPPSQLCRLGPYPFRFLAESPFPS